MKKAVAEAVSELANQQRAAANFFEAMSAYSPAQRRAALVQARGIQAATGLSFQSSMQLLEAQKRTFGAIQPEVTTQLAGYWALHGGPSTLGLVRWMGEAGLKTADEQGRILRMVGAVAGQTGLTDEEVIRALVQRGELFKYLGWGPEQAITNVGKVIGGLSPSEASRAMRSAFEAIAALTAEKAKQLKIPRPFTESTASMLDFIRKRAIVMSPEQQRAYMYEAFGAQAPYVSRFLLEPISPEMQQVLAYAVTLETAEEERQRVQGFLQTAEAQTEKAAGRAGVFETMVTQRDQMKVSIREYGKRYLEYLRRSNRLKYEKVKALGLSEELEYERAAMELWQTAQPLQPSAVPSAITMMPETRYVPASWKGIPLEQRIEGLEQATQNIYNAFYDSSIHYHPVVGEDTRGPRIAPGVQH